MSNCLTICNLAFFPCIWLMGILMKFDCLPEFAAQTVTAPRRHKTSTYMAFYTDWQVLETR